MKNKFLFCFIILTALSSLSGKAQERSKTLIKALETSNPEEYAKVVQELKITEKDIVKPPVVAEQVSSQAIESKETEAPSAAKMDPVSSQAVGNNQDAKPIPVDDEEISFSAKKKKETPVSKSNDIAKTEESIKSTDKSVVSVNAKKDTPSSKVNKPASEETKPIVEKVDTPPRVVVVPNPQYSNVNAAYKAELAKKNAEFEAANAKAATIADKVDYYKKLRLKFDQEAGEKRIKDSIAAIEKAKEDAKAYDARHLKPVEAPQFEKHRSGHVDPPVKKKTAEEEYNELFK